MKILLAEDDSTARSLLSKYIESQLGHQVDQCENGEVAFERYMKGNYPLVLSDIKMPRSDGIALLRNIKSSDKGKYTDVVLVTGNGDMNSAIDALRAGAYEYLLKPVNLEELDAVIEKIAEHQTLLRDNEVLTKHFDEKVEEATRETQSELRNLKKAYARALYGIGEIGIFSEGMKEVVRLTQILHEDPSVPVLIEGETGTGKEVVSRLVHHGDSEAENVTPFISINCSAISAQLFESELFGYEGGSFTGARSQGQKGKVELAIGGTLFLDEIGDMPLDMQPKLLRVLDEKAYYRVGGIKKTKLDCRIICATNRNLLKMVGEGTFRRDLYYRLNTGRLYIPPLRDRKEAIEPLASMFLEKYSREKRKNFESFDTAAMQLLLEHSWPGNIRELQNTIERVVLLYNEKVVKAEYLNFLKLDFEEIAGDEMVYPSVGQRSLILDFPGESLSLKQIETEVIKHVLDLFGDNRTKAAEYLGVSRNTLLARLKE